jgi:hypothetical protein
LARQAEEILEVAGAAGARLEGVILLDRQGGLRILEAAGWSPAGLAAEFGAAALFRIERRAGWVRVEGWSGSQRCLRERRCSPILFPVAVAASPYARTLQVRSGGAAGWKERSPHVWNA